MRRSDRGRVALRRLGLVLAKYRWYRRLGYSHRASRRKALWRAGG